MKAIGLIVVLLIALQMARHAGEKPQLLVDAVYTAEPATNIPWALNTRCTVTSDNLRHIRETNT